MSNAVMPLAHYKETCDAIREKTGSTDTIKSREMPDKINDVFRAGQLGIVSSAEALKGSASGSSVTIKDISPVEHNVDCKVGSKNLLNAMEIADYNAATDYVKDIENNSFILRGNEGGQYLAGSGQLMLPYTNTENITQKGVKVKGGVKYTISFDLLIMEQGIYNSNISLLIYTSALGNVPAGIVEGTLGTTVRRSITFTPTTDEIIGFCFRINNNYVTLSNIQVEEGSMATAYTPYIADISTVKVQRLGKNLFNGELKIWEGANRIGSKRCVKVKPNTVYTIYTFDYTISPPTFEIRGNHTGKYSMSDKQILGMTNIFNSGEYEYIWFREWKEMTQDGVTLESRVQVEEGRTATEYEPYIEPNEYTANADGTVDGIKSLYPTTTLMTDTEGVTISAEYIKDIDKTFNSLTTAVALTGGE